MGRRARSRVGAGAHPASESRACTTPVPTAGGPGCATTVSAVRALLVANPSATTTTAAGRDVIATPSRASSSSRWWPPATGATPPSSRPAPAPRGSTSSSSSAGDGTVNEALNGLLVDGPAPRLPRSAWCPAGRPTSSPAHSASPATRSRPRTSSWGPSRRAGAARWASGGPTSAGSASTPGSAGTPTSSPSMEHAARPGPRGHADPLRAHLVPPLGPGPARPAVADVEIPGREPIEGVEARLVSNTDPWTYLGGAAVRTNPGCSFDTGLGLFALRTWACRRSRASCTQILRSTAASGAAARWSATTTSPPADHLGRAGQPPGRRRPPRPAQRRGVRPPSPTPCGSSSDAVGAPRPVRGGDPGHSGPGGRRPRPDERRLDPAFGGLRRVDPGDRDAAARS